MFVETLDKYCPLAPGEVVETIQLSQAQIRSRQSFKEMCPFHQSVLSKKLNYFESFQDKFGNLKEDWTNKGSEYFLLIRKNLAFMEICQHNTRKCRAKFMCHSCYHALGNSRIATKCGHPDRAHHSRGMCKNCYHRSYYNKKMNIRAGNSKKDNKENPEEENKNNWPK